MIQLLLAKQGLKMSVDRAHRLRQAWRAPVKFHNLRGTSLTRPWRGGSLAVVAQTNAT